MFIDLIEVMSYWFEVRWEGYRRIYISVFISEEGKLRV